MSLTLCHYNNRCKYYFFKLIYGNLHYLKTALCRNESLSNPFFLCLMLYVDMKQSNSLQSLLKCRRRF